MALTLTQAELSAAIRLGDSTEEVAEATRLLTYVIEPLSEQHLGDAYEDAHLRPLSTKRRSALPDICSINRTQAVELSFANAGRNSGAWTILLPYRVHRAGTTGDAVAAAQEAMGYDQETRLLMSRPMAVVGG